MYNNDLNDFSFRNNSGTAQYSMDDGSTWVNFKNPTGTKSITANGTYDVTDYASVSVNVSASFYNATKKGTYTSATTVSGLKYGDILVILNIINTSVDGATLLLSGNHIYGSATFTLGIYKATSTSISLSSANVSGQSGTTVYRVY